MYISRPRRLRLKADALAISSVLGLAVLLLSIAGTVPATATPGSWSASGSLDDARSSHTATRLFGGEVLAAGGEQAGEVVASAELYDPDDAAWQSTAALASARSSHTATALPDGRVVVVGGRGTGDSPLASTEIFDPATETWMSAGTLATARFRHTATLLPNGRILVAGGVGANDQRLASAEVFNPASGEWTATGALADARSSHTATVLASGRVLIAGGTAADGGALASAELYDQGSGTWSPTGSLSSPRSAHSATALGDEVSGGGDTRVLVAGGVDSAGTPQASAELYDPGTGTWMVTGALAAERSSHTATLLPTGLILVAGGVGAGGAAEASGELYDPATAGWRPTGALISARSAHTATVLLSGRVLAVGGAGASDAALDSAESYEPDAGDRWQRTASLVNARSGHTATLLPSGDVLVTGGHRTTDAVTPPRMIDPLASSELYDPASGTWATVGALGRARSFQTATLLEGSPSECGDNCGKVLVAGGVGAQPGGRAETLASAELYDPATGTWSPTGSMTTARALHTATLLRNGKVLVVAGAGPGGAEPRNANQLASAELYDPATGAWTATGSLSGSTTPPATNTARGARLGHSAVLLDTGACGENCGKVLIAAGVGGVGAGPALSSAELYDPATGTFGATGDLDQARQLQAASVLPNGKVVVVGGFHNPFRTAPPNLAAAETYDPAAGTWTETGSLTARRIAHTATLLHNGRVLVAGGAGGGNAPGFTNVPGPGLFSGETFDTETNAWSGTSSLNTARTYQTATLLPTGPASACGGNCGKVLVVGGNAELIGTFAPYFNLRSPLASAELYTPQGGAPTEPDDGSDPEPEPDPGPDPTPPGDDDDEGPVRPNLIRPGFARAVQRGGRSRPRRGGSRRGSRRGRSRGRPRRGRERSRTSGRRSGGRIVVTLRGRMLGNRGRPCGGRLIVGSRVGRRRVAGRQARMGDDCRYSVSYSFALRRLPPRLRPRKAPLVVRVKVRFQGNSQLSSDLSPTRRIKVSGR